MKLQLALASVLLSSPALAQQQAFGGGGSLTQDLFKTACIWNDTAENIRVELQFDDLDPYTATIGASGWFSYSWVLRTPESRVPPLKLRFQESPDSQELTEPFILEPQLSGDVRNCARLRGVNLHYELKQRQGDEGVLFEVRGPTDDP
jgi:hypothetical protein